MDSTNSELETKLNNKMHLVETEVATAEKTYLLGVREQVGGRAIDYVDTITNSMREIETTLTPRDKTKPDILKSVSNTMTDRCATNHAVDVKLKEIKGASLHEFKCGMHPLDSIAKVCDKAVKQFELKEFAERQFEKSGSLPYTNRGESITQALVRLTGKLFHSCNRDLTEYLKMKDKIDKRQGSGSVYYQFVGNRFHIYFLSSGKLCHLSKSIVDFFSSVFTPKNNVHSSVLHALKLPETEVTLRALGLFGKSVTAPWMRLVAETKSILELNEQFQTALDRLQNLSKDAKPLLNPQSVFDNIPVCEDNVLISLTESRAKDYKTVLLLQDLCAATVEVMKKQLKDQIRGGVFWEPSDSLKLQAKSCSSTNISGERRFAVCDSIMARARNAKMSHVEAKTMYKTNGTGAWLHCQSDCLKAERTKLAARQACHVATQEKKHAQEVAEHIKQRLLESRKELLAKEDKDRDRYEQWLDNVYQNGGLWTDEHQIVSNCNKLTKSKAITAVKAQINVRCKVLQMDQKKKVLFTKCTLPELQVCLAEIINGDIPEGLEDLLEIMTDPRSIVGGKFSQAWEQDGNKDIWNGEVKKLRTNKHNQLEYELHYVNDDPCYMTVSEILVDIIREDMDIY